MMGFAMFTVDVPVTKTSSVLAFVKDPVKRLEETACICFASLEIVAVAPADASVFKLFNEYPEIFA